MAIVYILYSTKLDTFYIGSSTLSIDERVENHNNHYYDNKYTSKGIPWKVHWFHEIDSIDQALKIEKHIKSMKSRKFIGDIKKYPEIIEKLILRYS
jgi:putative endonuclease